MNDLPFDSIIGFPAMENLGTCIDLGKKIVSVHINDRTIKIPLDFYKSIHLEELREKGSQYFPSSFESEDSEPKNTFGNEKGYTRGVYNMPWDYYDSGFEKYENWDSRANISPECV